MRWIAITLLAVLFAGCAEDPDVDGTVTIEEQGPETIALAATYYNFTGTLTQLMAQGEAVAGAPFEALIHVPFGSARVDATLTWSDPAAQLSVLFPESMGGQQGVTSENGRFAVYNDNPIQGNHTLLVQSGAAVNVAFELFVVISPDEAITTLLSETVAIAPGAFFEINLQNQLYDNMTWEWSASAPVAFNLHTHFDGEVQYVVEETTNEHAGTYQVQRTGGHSFMWENTGATPLSVDYKIWGAFEIDSYFPPR